MAQEHDVDLGAVQGSGAAGRVMKQDVKDAIRAPAAATIAPTGTARSGALRSQQAKRTAAPACCADTPIGDRTEERACG